jgi:phenylalanyl-tRNA synthetase alpha subunit
MSDLDSIVSSAQAAFAAASTPADLENAKALFLGKQGQLTELMKGMAALSVDEKKTRGAAINVTKQAVEAALTARRQALADADLEKQLKAEALDVTLPGRQRGQGGLHPIALAWERVESIFNSMGFDVADGPEIENDWFNFTSLNNPPNHPARSMQDTFYVDMNDEQGLPYCLRTHTSPMQTRYAVAHAKKHAANQMSHAGQPQVANAPSGGSDPRAAEERGGMLQMPEIRVIVLIVSILMLPIPLCSTSLKACGSAKTSTSKTSKSPFLISAKRFLKPTI